MHQVVPPAPGEVCNVCGCDCSYDVVFKWSTATPMERLWWLLKKVGLALGVATLAVLTGTGAVGIWIYLAFFLH